MLFNAERSWDFTTFIKIINREHWLAGHVFDNIIGLWVSKVTTLVYWVPLFVVFTAILIFKYNNVSFVITVQFTKHIMLIESSQLSVRRNCNQLFLLLEILHHILVYINNRRDHIKIVLAGIESTNLRL